MQPAASYPTPAVNREEMADSRPHGLRFHHATPQRLGRILAAGWLTHAGMQEWRDPGHYSLALVVRGGGNYEDGHGLAQQIAEGCLVLGFPGLRHFYRPLPDTLWTEFYLVFDGPVFGLWESSGLLDRAMPVMQIRNAEHWARKLESILGPSGRPGTDPAWIEVCRLQSVLAELLWQGTGRTGGQDDLEWALRARAMLESDPRGGLSIAEVAARFAMPTHAFRQRFKHLVGESPARYRSARIIDRACELMQTTTLLDKQIADHLGFCDEFYFSRRFREITGKSPSEFRAILPQGRV